MPPKPFKIDVVDATIKAFSAVWEERHALLSLATFPIVIKALTYMLVVVMGLQDDLLRQGLYFIPSFFVEGWFIAAALRLVLYKERWPFFLTGDAQRDNKMIRARRTAIQGCGILYTLLRLISVVAVALAASDIAGDYQTLEEGSRAAEQAAPDMPFALSLVAFIAATALLVGSIWAYRYFCLYVPVALGIGIKTFLKSVWGFKSSFQFIFVSLLCFVPFFVVFGLVHGMLSALFPGAEIHVDHLGYSAGFALVQSLMETTISLFTAVALGVLTMDFVKKGRA